MKIFSRPILILLLFAVGIFAYSQNTTSLYGKHEFITYVVSYAVMKSSSGNNEVLVMQDVADVEIITL
jgi:hypothetical protein